MKVDREVVRDLVSRSCLLLDEERFDEYLDLYVDDFRYRVTAFSQELRKDMVWLDLGRVDLQNMFEMLPVHVKPAGTLARHVNMCEVKQNRGPDLLEVVSTLAIYFTDLQGATRILAIGRYKDSIDVSANEPRLLVREVRLDTRALGAGSLIPF
jgi:methanesulfonate monooxygenase small subunit